MLDKKIINFWNGNKSSVRQDYELALLEILLNLSPLQGSIIANDTTDYSNAVDEGHIFNHHADILVTVDGNKKFYNKPLIKLEKPICKGLLGQRVLIIRKQDQIQFNNITPTKLKKKIAGIPATWADADLFRFNGYNVLEQGSLEDIFLLLKQQKCDYISLGANEVQGLFDELGAVGELVIETSSLLYYPFPLVFYVHPAQEELANHLELALKESEVTGILDKLFQQHYGDVINALNINNRSVLLLQNPYLSEDQHYSPSW